jgi:hypothetical protein
MRVSVQGQTHVREQRRIFLAMGMLGGCREDSPEACPTRGLI